MASYGWAAIKRLLAGDSLPTASAKDESVEFFKKGGKLYLQVGGIAKELLHLESTKITSLSNDLAQAKLDIDTLESGGTSAAKAKVWSLAFKSTNSVENDTDTAIKFQSVTLDSDDCVEWVDSVTSGGSVTDTSDIISIKKTGYYLLTSCVSFPEHMSGNRLVKYGLHPDGGSEEKIIVNNISPTVKSSPVITSTLLRKLDDKTKVKLYVKQDSGEALTISSSGLEFSGIYIGT